MEANIIIEQIYRITLKEEKKSKRITTSGIILNDFKCINPVIEVLKRANSNNSTKEVILPYNREQLEG